MNDAYFLVKQMLYNSDLIFYLWVMQLLYELISVRLSRASFHGAWEIMFFCWRMVSQCVLHLFCIFILQAKIFDSHWSFIYVRYIPPTRFLWVYHVCVHCRFIWAESRPISMSISCMGDATIVWTDFYEIIHWKIMKI
jgi:hypothetical protein